jgi:hypothetical protein
MNTIFEGTINGEKFNSVEAYNNKMLELINAGVSIDATSHTKSVDDTCSCKYSPVDDTCKKCSGQTRCTCDNSCENKKLGHEKLIEAICNADDCGIGEKELLESLYPYFVDEDPYYLDALVGTDKEVNAEVLKDVEYNLDYCWDVIKDYFESDECLCQKKDYLNDVHDIIASIKHDYKANHDALVKVKNEYEKCNVELQKAKVEFETAKNKYKLAEEEYQNNVQHCNSLKIVLEDAAKVIELLSMFYKNVECEGIRILADKKCDCSGCNCDGNCEENIETHTKETSPQKEMELTDNEIIESFNNISSGLLQSIFKNIDMESLKKQLNSLKL